MSFLSKHISLINQAASNFATRKIYTFSAGPAIFPMEVLEKAQKEMLDFRGSGISLLEMSHRSKPYEKFQQGVEANIRKVMDIPKDFKVLFLQGGATMQFAGVPLNLMKGKPCASYLVSGHWSEKAVAEAKKYCKVEQVITPPKKFTTVADQSTWKIDPQSGYFYYCDNETIAGLEIPEVPDVKGMPVVADYSSNFASKPIDWNKYGLVFACAQKNFGPAGVSLVIVKDSLLKSKLPICPAITDYALMAKNDSLYNTAPTFGIYLVGLYFEYLASKGNMKYWDEQAKLKSGLIYDMIDNSNGFYSSPVDKKFRSRLNIPFLIKDNNKELQDKFMKEATAQGMIQLAGHRSVGGLRASIYNGMPVEGAEKLANFMKEFKKNN